MNKIFITLILLFSVCMSVSAIEISGINYDDPDTTSNLRRGNVMVKYINGKWAMAVYLPGGISVDSASISVDTAGLAGYTQLETLLNYCADSIGVTVKDEYSNDTWGNTPNADTGLHTITFSSIYNFVIIRCDSGIIELGGQGGLKMESQEKNFLNDQTTVNFYATVGNCKVSYYAEKK